MLERLELENVGPAPEVGLDLQNRLNLITGDNGLGKSFLLDVAWWALTRRWPRNLNPRLTSGYMARPTDIERPARLRFALTTDAGNRRSYTSTYSVLDQSWTGQHGRPWSPGLVIYAHADGGFSLWDPARNYWRKIGNIDVQDRLPGYAFSPEEVWSGLMVPIDGKQTRVCKGLLDDWSSWIRENGENAHRMAEVVGALMVPSEPWEVGPLLRLSVDDAQDIPSIKTRYSDAVPIVHASSAVRRIVGLAYMLVWSWSEHVRAAAQLNIKVAEQVILLFDEVDAHLHPRWQRVIVPAILGVVDRLTDSGTGVQLIATTHSPLVLASVEPYFDEDNDRLFHLDVHNGRVQLDAMQWAPQGDALNWLVSDSFGLRQARSVEAECAIDAAQAFMRGDAHQNPENLRDLNQIQRELERVLAGHDPFWPRWIVQTERRRGG
ncbi:MAG: AAA family ATPase [Gammaproteobacteria bacterium]|nr:AAA family ATPase [Gammaproteobacteria bacterium]MYB37099.1 AAA family ATPase [Gammaproteobacteria bacterium]